jgi:SAM-dependent methyltransferase
MSDVDMSNRETWRRVAHQYSGTEISEDDATMREIVRDKFCERLSGTRVLEIGCGPGTDAAKFAMRGLQVTATDYAPEFISIVRRRYPNLDARVMNMVKPDLSLSSFDGIYGFASFIHLPRCLANESLGGLMKLLAPGGLLFLVLIKSSKGIRKYTIESWAGQQDSPMLFTCYDEAEMESRLRQSGFVDIEFLAMPPSPIYENSPRLVERGISSYIVCARRAIAGSS